MTTPEFQADAMRTLGWMPTRKDLVDGLGNIFTVKDEYELARQAVRQLYPFGGRCRTPRAGRPRPAGSRAPGRTPCVTRHATAPIELAETLRRAQGAPR
jgi:hypothetical protein